MTKFLTAASCLLLSVCVAGSAQAQKRQHGAHQHGHGTLKIAIEGRTVDIELAAPGDDIVGFEHAPKTNAQKAAVEKAIQQLSSPLALFVLPAAAACTVKEAKADVDRSGGADHSEFKATYKLECGTPKALASIRFEFFKIFPRAVELDVAIVSEKAQKSYEVSRKKPQLSLSGIM